MKRTMLLSIHPVCFVLLGVVLTGVNSDQGYRATFHARSSTSAVFEPLRENKTATIIDECNKQVTEPFGILEQTYTLGSMRPSEICSWRLHTPDNNQIVNVISVEFTLANRTTRGRSDECNLSFKNCTRISLYDGTQSDENKLLTSYVVSLREKVGYFALSMSSKQDMLVQIDYHDNKDFETQLIRISYEFLNLDEMKELLRDF